MPIPSRLTRLAMLALAAALIPPLATAREVPLDALTPAQFDAAVIDAKRHARHEDVPGQPWASLDPDKLARMLRMPRFGTLDHRTKVPLIEQAGAWDVIHFDKPSDVQGMWARWFPEAGFDKKIGEADRDLPFPGVGWFADAHWAREAGAMIALKNCMPTPAWYVAGEDPMVWATTHGTWDQPNVFDFGKCVRMQSEQGYSASPGNPDTPRGLASAAIIEQKFSAWLLAHGCSGTGPDSCLTMLYALISLAPGNRDLPAIVRRVDADLEPETGLQLPPAPPQTTGRPEPSASELAVLTDIRKRATRRLIFLSMKLPIVLREPGAWPESELERSLQSAFSLARLMAQSSEREGWRDDGLWLDRRDWSRPWAALPPEANALPPVAALWTALGRETAALPGCENPALRIPGLPEPFWLAYSLEKLQRERTTCDALASHTSVAKRYVEARGRPALLAPIAALRPFLDTHPEGQEEPRSQVRETLGQACPAQALATAEDPWGVCTERAKRLAQEQRSEQADELQAGKQAEAAERKQLAEGGPCGDTLLGVLGTELAIGDLVEGSDGAHLVSSACKRWPAAPGLVLAALLYDTGDNANEDKREVVAVVDAKRQRVIGDWRTSMKGEPGMDTAGLLIDTARYQLAPGVRAFGVDLSNPYTPKLAEAGSGPARSLFILEGKRLRPVLIGLPMSEWADDGAGGRDNFALSIAVEKSSSHGFADLRIHAVKTLEGGRKSGRAPFDYLLHYDGKQYPLEEMRKAYAAWRK